MKRVSIAWSLASLVSVILFLSGSWAAPVPGDVAVDPYTVTLYENEDYDKPIGTWKLDSTMRMLKVAKVSKRPRSMLLGSKVNLLMFPGPDFSSVLWDYSERTPKGLPENEFLIPWFRFPSSSPAMNYGLSGWAETFPYSDSPVFSFVLHRADISDMLGVFIKYGGRGQFYALPENPGDTEIIYNKITQHYAKRLYYVAGGSGAMSLGGGSPSIYHITVTIAADQGLKLYLPDAKNLTADYDLTKYNVGQISSILLQYRGPWKNKESYRAGQITNPVANAPATTVNPVVNAPPSGPDTRTASTVSTPQPAQIKGAARKDVLVSAGKTSPAAIPDLSGQWKSSVGLMYALTQKGNQFEWTVAGTNEKAQGTVQGSAVSASWKGPQGSGSATGQITKVDASGKATQIEWKNGVKFFR